MTHGALNLTGAVTTATSVCGAVVDLVLVVVQAHDLERLLASVTGRVIRRLYDSLTATVWATNLTRSLAIPAVDVLTALEERAGLK